MSMTLKPVKSKLSTLLIDSSRHIKRILENEKTGGSWELFLPENDFQTNSTESLLKYICFGGMEIN